MSQTDLKTEKSFKSVLKQFKDPIRMMILIKILRKPDITSNELKKSLLIPGTKIYYYLNQLSNHKPPLIYESETEKVTEHLIRRKFRVTDEFMTIFNEWIIPKKNTQGFKLFTIYTSIALQYQRLREVKSTPITEDGEPDPYSLLMFVDDDIAEELRVGILSIFQKCSNRYREFDIFKALKELNFGAFAGIYPMN
ncbi:MAG: hypothetical protein GPJ54_01490 [Candidatus Heimdallarchaeota archaeon]|nr:hypothetical protein [Candidatus Heimdallarchaeota archaeon]